ncbi:amino acid ABC transporter permease [Xanthobacter sp. TB0139]|uniref:amino acid ABC transporter permease n=1 Tax=Xanthobacter sp. TB0139 TaxID=3459178 RepID=UPI004039AACD
MGAQREQGAKAGAYVADALIAARQPPAGEGGALHWVRSNLLGNWRQMALTLFGLWLLYVIVPPLVSFFLLDAVWQGDNREACLPLEEGQAVGACWPFIQAKFNQLIYGFYPAQERWRVNLAYGLGAALLLPLLVISLPGKRLNAALFFGAFPIVAFVLLTGGHLGLSAFLPFLPAALGFWGQTAVVAVTLLGAVALWSLWRVGPSALLRNLKRVGMMLVVAGLVLAAVDMDFGLAPVETRLWGGLLVTLVITLTGITVSLPFGIALALGRRSRLPLVRICTVAFIEFWRGVPVITVLFFAIYMLPLFLPGNMNIDALLKALVGVALFASAYMAEVVRGGLEAVPKGQFEGAEALGLKRTLALRLVVLPQALRVAIPGITNTFIGLFKDTTLVLIVAIFDLLGALRAAFTDPNWATPSTLLTGFGFAGLIYFAFSFGMSRYAQALERHLNREMRA